jgi:hypothetical protein
MPDADEKGRGGVETLRASNHWGSAYIGHVVG